MNKRSNYYISNATGNRNKSMYFLEKKKINVYEE